MLCSSKTIKWRYTCTSIRDSPIYSITLYMYQYIVLNYGTCIHVIALLNFWLISPITANVKYLWKFFKFRIPHFYYDFKNQTFSSKPFVCIVWSQAQPKLCTAGEHAIRFIGSLSNEVIYQNTNITFSSVNCEGRLSQYFGCCIDPSYNALDNE